MYNQYLDNHKKLINLKYCLQAKFPYWNLFVVFVVVDRIVVDLEEVPEKSSVEDGHYCPFKD